MNPILLIALVAISDTLWRYEAAGIDDGGGHRNATLSTYADCRLNEIQSRIDCERHALFLLSRELWWVEASLAHNSE
jgi:hypothetical protein